MRRLFISLVLLPFLGELSVQHLERLEDNELLFVLTRCCLSYIEPLFSRPIVSSEPWPINTVKHKKENLDGRTETFSTTAAATTTATSIAGKDSNGKSWHS